MKYDHRKNRVNHNENKNDITSEQVLSWAKGVEAERAQKTLLTNIHENKEFDTVRCIKHNKIMSNSQTLSKRRCQYCIMAHGKKMPISWEEIHRMWEPFPEGLQECQ